MKLLAWSVRFAKWVAGGAWLVAANVIRLLVRFAKSVARGVRLVAAIVIRLCAGRPSLDAEAPRWARVIIRPAASVGLLLCLAFLWLVVPSVIEALRSPDPWTREGLVVLLIVAWVGCDALRYCRLAIRPGAVAAPGTQSQAH